jgi:hypothetical protein
VSGRVRFQGRLQEAVGKRVKLLQAQNGHVVTLEGFALLQQFVINFARAQQDAADFFRFHRCIGQDALECSLAQSASVETARGSRSRLLGVITISGLRQERTTCRRKQ